jgi:hypothetical protein
MGLDLNGMRFLLFSKRMGVSFEKTATIGRQTLQLSPSQLRACLKRANYECSIAEAARLTTDAGGYADQLFKKLGARAIISFDASDYEGATCIHDFNQPIPEEFKNRFSAVLDGGTLEHIFNFPVAIRDCMEMVEVGGHFLGISPTNNHLGHGFYQFSPELYFRIFTEKNGFELEQLAIYEETPGCPWYEVTDPEVVKERVILVNDQPTMLLIRAKKIRETEINLSTPYQSDYSAIWESSNGAASSVSSARTHRSLAARLASAPASLLKRASIGLKHSRGMLAKRQKHFKKFDPEAP